MLSIPYSYHLSSEQQLSGTPETVEHHEALREGNSFPQRFSQGQKSTPFIHGTEHIKSERIKAVPQNDLGINLISTHQ
jgi:hypothetical protein